MPTKQVERRAVWCETLSYERLCSAGLLQALSSRDISLFLAVCPSDLGDLARTLAICEAEGVAVSLWPMLNDADGRWANASTMSRYCAFAERMAQAAEGRWGDVIFDLEPPIAEMRAALDSPRKLLIPRKSDAFGPAKALAAQTIARLRERGHEASAALIPVVLADGPEERLARAFGTPVAGLPWARLHTMMYTSLIEGYAPRIARRRDCISALHLVAKRARVTFGDRAALSLGVAGPGALGDERPFASLEEFCEDVATARAAGIKDLALFDLGGVVRRGPVEPWLDALVHTEPRAPRLAPSSRVRAACALAAIAGQGASVMLQALRQ